MHDYVLDNVGFETVKVVKTEGWFIKIHIGWRRFTNLFVGMVVFTDIVFIIIFLRLEATQKLLSGLSKHRGNHGITPQVRDSAGGCYAKFESNGWHHAS